MVWRFLIKFADILGLWPFMLDEFVQAFHDYDPRLLGEIHVALLRSIIKDIEDVARTPSSTGRVNQNVTLILEVAIHKLLKGHSIVRMKVAKGKGINRGPKGALKPIDDCVGKRKVATKANKGGKSQAKKGKLAKKDPNKPKRPSKGFFVFQYEFRKTFKKENPHVKVVSAISSLSKSLGKIIGLPDSNYTQLTEVYNKYKEKALVEVERLLTLSEKREIHDVENAN
ncbi:Homeobox-DDT domain protein RLT1 [Camellia lanceoleosa]|uniref:Homeobox-DDT domain protein RLT1 n=1 Tax=Camellia lanceoleosa TaxID=1840588 RepID=A0ACC0IRS2_9ERIC|nr:Homeobox-DDT domain protein RLT1 [Camellia lanceoleosa]